MKRTAAVLILTLSLAISGCASTAAVKPAIVEASKIVNAAQAEKALAEIQLVRTAIVKTVAHLYASDPEKYTPLTRTAIRYDRTFTDKWGKAWELVQLWRTTSTAVDARDFKLLYSDLEVSTQTMQFEVEASKR